VEPKVLVADDDLSIRQLLYDTLSKAGYRVFTTHGGREAVELVKEEKPDLVLLDFKMSDISGIEVLKEIRSFDKKTKIIMLTGMGTQELEREARLLGAGGFLRKNLGVDVIVKTINQLLQIQKDYGERKILVIDDDPGVCSIIKDFLAKKGYTVITALTGEDGLEQFKRERPILILLDIKLPGMDGIVTLQHIREIDDKVGVIMVTGVDSEDVLHEVRKLGASEYIVKPFDLDYLETCVLVRIALVSALL
jgi:two-component system response regulator (stage 0 sporulation protein F)